SVSLSCCCVLYFASLFFPPLVTLFSSPSLFRSLPRLGRFRFLRGPSSSLTPLWYLHSIVRFEGLVCPPCLCASMWWTWHLSAGTLQSGQGQTRFSAIARVRSLSEANRAS